MRTVPVRGRTSVMLVPVHERRGAWDPRGVFVAQTASLLYRREVSCRSALRPEGLNCANALTIGSRRNSGLTAVSPVRIVPPTHGRDARATTALRIGNRRCSRLTICAKLIRYSRSGGKLTCNVIWVSGFSGLKRIVITLPRFAASSARVGALASRPARDRADARDWRRAGDRCLGARMRRPEWFVPWSFIARQALQGPVSIGL